MALATSLPPMRARSPRGARLVAGARLWRICSLGCGEVRRTCYGAAPSVGILRLRPRLRRPWPRPCPRAVPAACGSPTSNLFGAHLAAAAGLFSPGGFLRRLTGLEVGFAKYNLSRGRSEDRGDWGVDLDLAAQADDLQVDR